MAIGQTIKTAKKISPLIVGLLSLMWSCISPTNSDYADFVTLNNQQWAYGDTLRYVATDATDSIVNGPLIITVCHDDDFLYANLWVEVTYRLHNNARTLKRDTLNLPIANRYGQWYGQGFGSTFQTSDTVAPDFSLHRGDTLLLRHVVRVDTLKHITQIGFSINNKKH